MRTKAMILMLLTNLLSVAQVTNEGKPKSWAMSGISTPAAIILPKIDIERLRAEDALNDLQNDAPWRFGEEIIVDYNMQNAGEWTALKNGDRIWRLRFNSKDARTLNFLFSDFYMPQGATLYLYNNERNDLLGAYDSAQNNDERVLGTWLVNGSDVWLEYYEPKAVAGQGKLEVFKVVHGYRSSDEFLKSPDDDLNGSGNCNYDVNCAMVPIDAMKNQNKNSVALMVVNSTSFCTGALINNTSNNATPYFLTANHCYSNPASWAFRFKWISPNPVCAQNTASTNTSAHLTISGATLRARRANSDFCLVEINSSIPAAWNLTWAGWDRSNNVSPFTFGIHHPSGDIMKACYDANPPLSLDDAGNYWMIQDWDMGVTEGGSSGSPLFNNQGKIIGQLWRGSASCAGTTDNGGSDDYGRLNVSWGAGSTTASRLKEWLDPSNSGVMSTDSYPPAQVFAINAKASVIGVPEVICGSTVSPTVRISNPGSSLLTSALVSYAMNFNFPTELPWTGNILPGEFADISLPEMSVSGSGNVFYANIEAPNGVPDQFPADNIASAPFEIAAAFETSEYTFSITTDNYGVETNWEINDSTGLTIASGGPYDNNTSYNQAITLPLDECYTFSITDLEGDGICCDYGIGSYSLKTLAGTTLIAGGNFGGGESFTFHAKEPLSNSDFNVAKAIVYPNPSTGIFKVSYDEPLQYTVFNILGQAVGSGTLDGGLESEINLSSQPSGMYLLILKDQPDGPSGNIKLIKQ